LTSYSTNVASLATSAAGTSKYKTSLITDEQAQREDLIPYTHRFLSHSSFHRKDIPIFKLDENLTTPTKQQQGELITEPYDITHQRRTYPKKIVMDFFPDIFVRPFTITPTIKIFFYLIPTSMSFVNRTASAAHNKSFVVRRFSGGVDSAAKGHDNDELLGRLPDIALRELDTVLGTLNTG
jgi:hypothetical protein